MKYLIEVTQADIDSNNKTNPGLRCQTCPVAKAMARALGRPIEVGSKTWGLKWTMDEKPLPKSVISFIHRLDVAWTNNKDFQATSVKPFSFEVEL